MNRDISATRLAAGGAPAPAPTPAADYLDKLYKIIPTELTAAYLAISSLLTDQADPLKNLYLLIGFGVLLTVLTPVYLMRLQDVRNAMQIVVSTISFPVWAIAISTPVVTLAWPILTPQVITVIMVGWVLITPVLVRR